MSITKPKEDCTSCAYGGAPQLPNPCLSCMFFNRWQPVSTQNQSTPDTPCQDQIIELNVALLRERSNIGATKYGVTLAGSGLKQAQYLRHALEEALDLANYLMGALELELARLAALENAK